MSDLEGRAFVVKCRDMSSPIRILEPLDEHASEALDKYKIGSEILVTFRKPRSLSQHRLLFAVLRKVCENSDKWADEECLLDDLKLATGLCALRTSPITGEMYSKPLSISFGSMTQDRFDAWLKKALAVLAEHLGTDPEVLLAEASA